MGLEFTDRVPEPKYGSRKPYDTDKVLNDLRERAGQYAIYSTHSTRQAARSRIMSLKNSASYKGFPLEWRTMKETPRDEHSPVHVLVRWLEGEEAPIATFDVEHDLDFLGDESA